GLTLMASSGAEAKVFHRIFVWGQPARPTVGFANHGHHDRADVLDGGRCLACVPSAAKHAAAVLLIPVDDRDLADDGDDVAADDAVVVLERAPPHAIVPHAIEQSLAELGNIVTLIVSGLRRRSACGEGGTETALDLGERFVCLMTVTTTSSLGPG